jgi:FixJ family two-component response regulator
MHFSTPGPIRADSKLCLTEQPGLITRPPTVFVVDHDAAVRDSLSVTLTFSGFEVFSFESGNAFIQSLPLRRGGCLLVEFDLEDMTGLELFEHVSAERVTIPMIMMSARLRLPVLESKLPKNVIVLQKPFGRDELLDVLRRAIGK